MVKITYIEANGDTRVVDAKLGQTVMETATKNGVPGIAADCGGSCACGTCRIYPEPEWREKLPARGAMEAEMLDFSADDHPAVRLSCQIKVTEELDGMVVRLPASQH
jgi:2Fe-2S ferredoxin